MQTYISEDMSFIEIKSRYFSFVNYYLVDESLDLEKLRDRKILSAFSKRFLSYQKEIQQCDKWRLLGLSSIHQKETKTT